MKRVFYNKDDAKDIKRLSLADVPSNIRNFLKKSDEILINNNDYRFVLDKGIQVNCNDYGINIDGGVSNSIQKVGNLLRIDSSICFYDFDDFKEDKNFCCFLSTKKELISFIKALEKLFPPKKRGKPYYAVVDSYSKSKRSGCPGPVYSWNELVPGWKISSTDDGLNLFLGLKYKKWIDGGMFGHSEKYDNTKYSLNCNSSKYMNIVSIIEKYIPLSIHSVTLRCENKEERVIVRKSKEEEGCYDIDLIVFNENRYKEFNSYCDEVDNSPYDPAVWGWT